MHELHLELLSINGSGEESWKKSLWSALETAPSLDAFGDQRWQKDDRNCGRRVFAVCFPRFPSSLAALTLLVSLLRSIGKLLRGVLPIVIPNTRHLSFSLFFHAMWLYIVLKVVSLNAVVASAVTGLICSLKVGVFLTSACLCSYVTTCRPLVWLPAPQQSISRPEQRIHNVRSQPPSAFSKCHRRLVKTHLSPICTSRASVAFTVLKFFFLCVCVCFYLPACLQTSQVDEGQVMLFVFCLSPLHNSNFDMLMEEQTQRWE